MASRSAYLINGDDMQLIKCFSKQNVIVKKRGCDSILRMLSRNHLNQ
jgi:hypothetical protein